MALLVIAGFLDRRLTTALSACHVAIVAVADVADVAAVVVACHCCTCWRCQCDVWIGALQLALERDKLGLQRMRDLLLIAVKWMRMRMQMRVRM